MAKYGPHTILDQDDFTSGTDISSTKTLHTFTMTSAEDVINIIQVGGGAKLLAGGGTLSLQVYVNDVPGPLTMIAPTVIGGAAATKVILFMGSIPAASGQVIKIKVLSDDANAADVYVDSYLCRFEPSYIVNKALPDAAADAAGGLPVSDAGGLDLDTLLGRLDAAISSRLATGSYTAPDNAGIGTAAGQSTAAAASAASADGKLPADTTTRINRLDADVSSRLATSGYTAPNNSGISDIKEKTDKLLFDVETSDVKATLDGEKVTVTSNEDKAGYALSAAGVTAIWATVIDGSKTALQVLRKVLSYVGGTFTQTGTTTKTIKRYRQNGSTVEQTETVNAGGRSVSE